MSSFLLKASFFENSLNSFTDKLSTGAMMILIGMGTIFAVLALIWLVLTLLSMSFNKVTDKKPKETVIANSENSNNFTVAVNETEIVAAITAAIAFAESESDNDTKFTVVSFKKR